MSFERNKSPYRTLRIGSGRFVKVIEVSQGANVPMGEERTEAMFLRWAVQAKRPLGVWPLIEIDGKRKYVETSELLGEIVKYNGSTYRIPEHEF